MPEAGGIEAKVRRLLDTIGDPCSVAQGVPMGLDEMGLLERVEADADGNVEVDVRLTSPSCMMLGYFKVEAERLAHTVDGVAKVTIKFDTGFDWRPEMMSATARRRRRDALLARGGPDIGAPERAGAVA